MTHDEAKQLALEALAPQLRDFGDYAEIVDPETIRKPYGWIFFWDSHLAMTTHDPRYFIAGNGPVVVLARDRTVHFLGTARSVESEIAAFEHRNGLAP